MSLDFKGEPEGTVKTFTDNSIFLDSIVIRCLPKKRYKLITCKHMFACYVVIVLNGSSKNVTINIGKSKLGSRSIDCEEGNFGISLKPDQPYQFQLIKCFFGEEIFIESTDKNLFVSTKRLRECANPKVVLLSDNDVVSKIYEGGVVNRNSTTLNSSNSHINIKSPI